MTNVRRLCVLLLLVAMFSGVGCEMMHKGGYGDASHAIAVIRPTESRENNHVHGWVKFHQHGAKVHVTAEVQGLDKDALHAIHIHELGDISSGNGKSTGGHYNPDGHDHALPGVSKRHAGDLGNLHANGQGVATLDLTVDVITINGRWNPILGRAIIIHAKKDDGGQPTGNAGSRLGQGAIGLAKAQ
ncbi:MAG: superoxide dismutase family protein [Phycisphaeraceae bacterium]|jgi:Cu-Zn family superoxide dismutase|nr:superoxide dismutase family protein [Phycisphaeraceae bacterium]MDP7346928.1 superoxide dismutase family protein [Phycisphaeraceae bacterium]